MCGIVGFIGNEPAAPILLQGLSKLEYRGYDSAGIAVRDQDAPAEIIKSKGRLKLLQQKTDNGHALKGSCGIGHTRWATHGEPSEINAHPHCSDDRSVIAVHNGIIDNYTELKEKLLKKGYTFYSDTDTEVAVKLIDYYYKKSGQNPLQALISAMTHIRGSYAFAVMYQEYPGEIYVARKDSPMIIGVTSDACYIASDVPAILNHTRSVYYIDNMEIGRLRKGKAAFYNMDEEEVSREPVEIKWNAESAEKGGFEHFMMKEIYEQPKAVSYTLYHYLKNDRIDLTETGLTPEILNSFRQICIVACGSAYHVGITAQYAIESLARIPVRVEVASEFRYRDPILSEDELVIIISQSGETADSLAALREAKKQGSKTLAIVNVVGSSIAREADYVMYTMAGPEIAVATTKAYSTQLIAMYLLALEFARDTEQLTDDAVHTYIQSLQKLPEQIEKILDDKERIQWFAAKFSNIKDAFFIGRGIDYSIGLEGSLKMKEISYVHSEAYAAGELKHGTISLVEDGTLVIGILTQPALQEKTLSNLVEVKSRGAYLMGLTSFGNYTIEDSVDFTVYIPKTDPLFANSLAIIPLQLLGYYMSVARGLDVDKPRNLAKSVTVE